VLACGRVQDHLRTAKVLLVALGEGCLSGTVAAAVTICGLAFALDGLMDPRHPPRGDDILLLFGSPFVGALAARLILPISGRVPVVWLGGACLAGLAIGMRTRPWPYYWGPEQIAYQNAIWVGASVTLASCAVAVWTRWRAWHVQRAEVAGTAVRANQAR
jgi:hypothetical protein